MNAATASEIARLETMTITKSKSRQLVTDSIKQG